MCLCVCVCGVRKQRGEWHVKTINSTIIMDGNDDTVCVLDNEHDQMEISSKTYRK